MTTTVVERPRFTSRLVMAVAWLVLTAALVAVGRGLPWRNAAAVIANARFAWLLAAVAANAAIVFVWTVEWRWIAPRPASVAFARMFECVATMAAVLNSVPFFAGEATGVALLIERVGLTRSAALSVLAVDQLLSGLGKLTVLAVTAIVVPLPAWLRGGVLALSLGVGALLVTLVPIAHRWERLSAALASNTSALRRLAARTVSVGRHLESLRETHRATRLAFLALLKKSLELSAIMSVQAALGLHVSPTTALLVLACVSVSNVAPIAPGNVGVYEAAAFAGYRYAGVSAETALGLAIVQHLCFLAPMLAIGYATLTARQLSGPRRSSRGDTSPRAAQ